MSMLKSWVKRRIKQVFGLPTVKKAVNYVQMQCPPTPYGMSYWYEGNLWEPPVQIAIRDLCKPGDIAFDIGANFGGLTTVMSRMVGPKGIVCAFEASPRIVDKTQYNVIVNGCSNVQVYNEAVYHTSNVKMPIYLGGHLNDRIYSTADTDKPAFYIQTIAIDDFVKKTGLTPDFIKMDIEGAEFDALNGMLNTIEAAKPHMILETQPNDPRCLDLLRAKGYISIDLNSYREIQKSEDYPKGVNIRNNLYIHRNKLSQVAYKPPFTFIEVITLTQDDFTVNNNSTTTKNPIKLEKGRYLIDVDFVAEGTQNEMMCGVKIANKVIFRYHAYTRILAENYRDWIIDLSDSAETKIYFDFLNNTRDDTFKVNGAKISRIAQFDSIQSQLYF